MNIDNALSARILETSPPAEIASVPSSNTSLPGDASAHENVALDIEIAAPLIGAVAPAAPQDAGEFVSGSFTSDAGTRSYKLYIPAQHDRQSREPMPLLVMLHGCTQSPEDFAIGTRMNELADRHGFLVVYPAQPANANGSRCWNWFRAEDQARDGGEPSLIAGITREVAGTYCIDERRIFVAGLSAGAAMAVVLGTAYPELYAAVGAHSGMPYAAAHDMFSAFAAMQGGGLFAGMLNNAAHSTSQAQQRLTVPTIVFHGDCDRTVNARNGFAIVQQATQRPVSEAPLRSSVDGLATSGGRSFSRTVYADVANQPVVEGWVLHGAGHAWSGGNAEGSFTDALGPDASAEMIRFFYSQQRAKAA